MTHMKWAKPNLRLRLLDSVSIGALSWRTIFLGTLSSFIPFKDWLLVNVNQIIHA